MPLGKCGQLFRCGQVQRPLLAALKGDALRNLRLFAASTSTDESGKSKEVRQRHQCALRRMQSAFRDRRFWPMSLAGAIVAMHRERAAANHWKSATLQRELANVAGAFQDLPLYSNSPVSFSLNDSAEFRNAMRATQLRANEEQIGSQPAATMAQTRRAISKAPDVPVKVAIALTYSCAGRVGDVLKVKRQEVTMEKDFMATGAIKVAFCRGKGARFSQPYTVPTTCPPEWRSLVHQYLQGMESSAWLFPGGTQTFGVKVNMALRAVDPEFTVRALRRGALQAMARAGVSIETLLLFSGHKRVETLLRYLNWGAEADERAQLARAAALHLVA